MKLFAQLCICLIVGIRPLFGPANCKFTIGCTEYAILQLNKEPFLKACKNILKRLFLCIPFL